MLARLVARWRALWLPQPTAGEWDRAYSAGRWDFLTNQAESPRLALVAHYVRLAAPRNAAILDLGCGEGALNELLRHLPFQSLVGVDLSSVAIDRARARASARERFVVGDSGSFVPDRPVDVIMLNELLYYLGDPVGTVRRLLPHLKPGGALVVSIYDKPKTRWLWRALARHTDTIDAVRLVNEDGTRWRVAWLGRR